MKTRDHRVTLDPAPKLRVGQAADVSVPEQDRWRTGKPAIVMHDRDTKFTQKFVSALEARGVRSNALPKALPNLNGRCERVIQTLKLECLRKFLLFGQRHLDHILREFTEYYNRIRSHTERDHLPPIHAPPDEVPVLESEQVVVKSYVGGLVKSFERKAAVSQRELFGEGLNSPRLPINKGKIMADNSSIEWTDATWNPVAGCEAISPGCLNCYAALMARRLEAMGQRKYAGTARRNEATGRGEFTGVVRPWADDLTKPFEWKKPKRIFVNSMSDLFHEAVPTEFIDRVYAVMELCPHHTFQVLTKRAYRMWQYTTDPDTPKRVQGAAREIAKGRGEQVMNAAGVICWPTWNVWQGVTAENQKYSDERIPYLKDTPSNVRFVSAEPLLGPVRFSSLERIHQIIVGGESGPNARPCNVEWIRSIAEQCKAASVPVFVKQLGASVRMSFDEWNDLTQGGVSGSPKFASDEPGSEFGIWTPADKKGGDPEEWPEDLRVREFPEVGR